jgi:anti-sigma regulatory factor (Ser/Thr protein kinase)
MSDSRLTILCISSDKTVQHEVSKCLHTDERLIVAETVADFESPATLDAELFILDYSDSVLSRNVSEKIAQDPWLFPQNIIPIVTAYAKKDASQSKLPNILADVRPSALSSSLSSVLAVIRQNRCLLWTRTHTQVLKEYYSGVFSIANSITESEVLVNLVCTLLYNTGKITGQGRSLLKTALMELLINAIEHGNCEIGYGEKKHCLENNSSIHALMAKKLQNENIRKRRVCFSYTINDRESLFTITDEGKGFNWRKYIEETGFRDYTGANGRGIIIAFSTLNTLQYNSKGNVVHCSISNKTPGSNDIPALFNQGKNISLPAGVCLTGKQEFKNSFFFIISGRLRFSIQEVLISTIPFNHAFIAETSLPDDEEIRGEITTITPVSLIQIDRDTFLRNVYSRPQYGVLIANILAHRLNSGTHVISRLLDPSQGGEYGHVTDPE